VEKRKDWGAEYPAETHNGEWEFQAFNADKFVTARRISIVASEGISMKLFAAPIAIVSLMAVSMAQGQESSIKEEVRSVPPALAKYTQDTLLGDVWKRPGLSPRDRSIVTLAALIARNQTVEMPFYLGARSITA
jgi:alkylhydroperoxidase/carboxymuconolactone decarboxylase family protein YurZ